MNNEEAAQVVAPFLANRLCELLQRSHEKCLAEMGDLQERLEKFRDKTQLCQFIIATYVTLMEWDKTKKPNVYMVN